LILLIQDWIDKKFKDIASKLPTLVHTEPASFACGFNVGYKQALLDLDQLLEEITEEAHNNNLL
jgi:hypothetical protein